MGMVFITSYLVKEHEGKYYYQLHNSPPFHMDDVITMLGRFHEQVYYSIVIGEVSVKSKDMWGANLFPLADRQISEEERIRELLYIPKSDNDEN